MFQSKDKCAHCLEKGLNCSGSRFRGQTRNEQPTSSLASLAGVAPHARANPIEQQVAATTILPNIPVRLELVGLYFDLIHDQFHTLFHRPSFIEAVARDEAPHVVLYALLALSARCVERRI